MSEPASLTRVTPHRHEYRLVRLETGEVAHAFELERRIFREGNRQLRREMRGLPSGRYAVEGRDEGGQWQKRLELQWPAP